MARKHVLKTFKMYDALDLSGSGTSSVTNVENLDKASIMIDWSGTSPTGTITVEAQNGPKEPWFELDMGGTISVSGNTGNHRLIFNELPFTNIRLQYAQTGGTGSLDAVINAKTVGA